MCSVSSPSAPAMMVRTLWYQRLIRMSRASKRGQFSHPLMTLNSSPELMSMRVRA